MRRRGNRSNRPVKKQKSFLLLKSKKKRKKEFQYLHPGLSGFCGYFFRNEKKKGFFEKKERFFDRSHHHLKSPTVTITLYWNFIGPSGHLDYWFSTWGFLAVLEYSEGGHGWKFGWKGKSRWVAKGATDWCKEIKLSGVELILVKEMWPLSEFSRPVHGPRAILVHVTHHVQGWDCNT